MKELYIDHYIQVTCGRSVLEQVQLFDFWNVSFFIQRGEERFREEGERKPQNS